MKPEQALFPLLFFVLCFLGAAVAIPLLARFFRFRLSSQQALFGWGTGVITLMLLVGLVLVSVSHLGMWGYLALGALLFLCLLYVGVMFYTRRRSQ